MSVYGLYGCGGIDDEDDLPRGVCHWHMVVLIWFTAHPVDCAPHLCAHNATASSEIRNLTILNSVGAQAS